MKPTTPRIQPPGQGDDIPPCHPSPETLDLLMHRRSVIAANLSAPGPSAEQINMLLTAGTRVPDHGKLAPWRFILFQGSARTRFGKLLAATFKAANPTASDAQVAFESHRFLRAPLVVAVVSHLTKDHKIPLWEQELSSGASCQTLLIAANAMGFASQWLTEWYAYDEKIASALHLTPEERIAGFIYIGSSDKPCLERARPNLDDLITHWTEGEPGTDS